MNINTLNVNEISFLIQELKDKLSIKENHTIKSMAVYIPKVKKDIETIKSIISKLENDKPKTLKTGEYAYDKLIDQFGYK